MKYISSGAIWRQAALLLRFLFLDLRVQQQREANRTTEELSRLPGVQSRLNYSKKKKNKTATLLDQVVGIQVALQDVVLHHAEDKPDVVCVCGAREMGVDDFFLIWVKTDKHV